MSRPRTPNPDQYSANGLVQGAGNEAALLLQLNQQKAQLAELTQQLADAKEQNTIENDGLRSAFNQKLTALRAQNETQKTSLENQLVDIKKQHTVVLEHKESAHQALQSNQDLTHEKAVAELNQSHEQAIRELKAEMQQLSASHNGHIDQLNQIGKEALGEKVKEIQGLNAAHENTIVEIQSLKADHEKTVAKLKEEHQSVITLRNQLTQDTAEGHKLAIGDLGRGHLRHIEQIQGDHAAAVESLEKKHNDAVGHLQKTHADDRATALARLAKEAAGVAGELKQELKEIQGLFTNLLNTFESQGQLTAENLSILKSLVEGVPGKFGENLNAKIDGHLSILDLVARVDRGTTFLVEADSVEKALMPIDRQAASTMLARIDACVKARKLKANTTIACFVAYPAISTGQPFETLAQLREQVVDSYKLSLADEIIGVRSESNRALEFKEGLGAHSKLFALYDYSHNENEGKLVVKKAFFANGGGTKSAWDQVMHADGLLDKNDELELLRSRHGGKESGHSGGGSALVETDSASQFNAAMNAILSTKLTSSLAYSKNYKDLLAMHYGANEGSSFRRGCVLNSNTEEKMETGKDLRALTTRKEEL